MKAPEITRKRGIKDEKYSNRDIRFFAFTKSMTGFGSQIFAIK
jgi:hypothetical protein